MSKKFHITDQGEVRACTAADGNCPLNPEAEHYATQEAAREAYEASQGGSTVSSKSKRFTVDDVYAELESGVKLDSKKARKLFDRGLSRQLESLDDDVRETLFDQARDAVMDFEGRENWSSVFNEYASRANLVALVGRSPATEEFALGELGTEVNNSDNRLGMLYYTFRKNKNLSDEQAKDAIEGAYPLFAGGINEEAREAVFRFAADRKSADGWGAVAEEYSSMVDVLMRAR